MYDFLRQQLNTYLTRIGTQEVNLYRFEYKRNSTVYLVDTPGFDDSYRTDYEVLQEIASFLKVSFQDGVKLNGIIYLHRISDNRLQGSAIRCMNMFRKIVGGGTVYQNIILATTMWESVDPTVGTRREIDLVNHSSFWSKLKQEGCQIRRHQNTKTAAMELVSFFIKERTDKVVLSLQEDLVTKNKELADTAAGKEARDRLAEEVENQRRELKNIKAQLQEALKGRSKDIASALHEERRHSRAKAKKLQKDYATFSEDMRRGFEEASKRQEVKIMALTRGIKTVKREKSRIDKKLIPPSNPFKSTSWSRQTATAAFNLLMVTIMMVVVCSFYLGP